jgi:hypothetical protein
MSWFSKPKKCANLFDAIAQANAAEVARFLSQADFTLIEGAVNDDGSKGAVTGEVNDFPVLVAFTSNDYAAQFAGANDDLLDENGDLPAFVVGGSDLLRYLPEGFGIVFNPESDNEKVIAPKLVRDVRNTEWG